MEFDSQLLHDVLHFLQTLGEVPLPTMFEGLRNTLLGRMQTALSTADNYIDMQPGKQRHRQSETTDNSSEEYVIPDIQPIPHSFLYRGDSKKVANTQAKRSNSESSRPPTYLLLHPEEPLLTPPAPVLRQIKLPEVAFDEDTEATEEEEEPPEVYATMTTKEAKEKSQFSGNLQKRERRFFFETLRPLWAALVGSYIICYDVKNEEKPLQLLTIKKCTCSAVPLTPRNVKKMGDSTFELCYEDNRSFQFITATPNEMEQWIAAVRRAKTKTRDVTDVHKVAKDIVKLSKSIPEAEPAAEDANLNEEYEDIVIHNIADALAYPEKSAGTNSVETRSAVKPSPLKSTLHLSFKAKQEVQKRGNVAVSDFPKRIIRDLPPTPPTQSSQASQHDNDEVYNTIEDSDHRGGGENGKFGSNMKETMCSTDSVQTLYDDIDSVKNEVEQIVKSEKRAREVEKADDVGEDEKDVVEWYDDVAFVKMEAEDLKRKEEAARKSAEVEREKKTSKEPPKTPTKPSPKKGFFQLFKNSKNESPYKESAPSPEQQRQTSIKSQLSLDLSAEETYNDVSNQTPSDLSDYNSPPPPRPVKEEIYTETDGVDDEGESIYYDIGNKKAEVPVLSHIGKSSSEKRKMVKNILSKIKLPGEEALLRASPIVKSQKKVVRNLSNEFEIEIYQNQTADASNEDSVEHYQVPRADANAHNPSYLGNDASEEIYDDVDIAAQKKQEIERAKTKPVVQTPSKFNRVPVVGKPSENNSLKKIRKLPSPITEKPASERKIHNPFNVKKKYKVQEDVIPLGKGRTAPDDNEIYDDCHVNRSFNA